MQIAREPSNDAPTPRIPAIGALAILALTAGHHLYGAHRFATPWRAEMAYLAGGVALILMACLAIARWAPRVRRPALWTFAITTLVLPAAWVGGFEGGYNHVVKDIAYGVGAPPSLLRQFFPQPIYAPPVDAWFEISGILQLPLGLWLASSTLAFLRTLRRGPA